MRTDVPVTVLDPPWQEKLPLARSVIVNGMILALHLHLDEFAYLRSLYNYKDPSLLGIVLVHAS